MYLYQCFISIDIFSSSNNQTLNFYTLFLSSKILRFLELLAMTCKSNHVPNLVPMQCITRLAKLVYLINVQYETKPDSVLRALMEKHFGKFTSASYTETKTWII